MPDTNPKDDLIPKRELLEYRAEVKGELFRALRAMFKRVSLTQADIARRLNADPALISKRFSGVTNMQLETMSDLARAMDCRIDVTITPFSEVALEKAFHRAEIFSDVWTAVPYPTQLPSEPTDIRGNLVLTWEPKRGPKISADDQMHNLMTGDNTLVANA